MLLRFRTIHVYIECATRAVVSVSNALCTDNMSTHVELVPMQFILTRIRPPVNEAQYKSYMLITPPIEQTVHELREDAPDISRIGCL